MPWPDGSRPDGAASPGALSAEADRPPLVVICGATETGKTELSLAIAEQLGGLEIISADSRQVYRGMDIGTAKVSAAARRRIAHHGLDLVEPDQAFTVADFARHADAALAGIASRGLAALLVGGSGLYLRTVARGIPIVETGRDPRLRERLEGRLAGEGLAVLVAELRGIAPAAADMTDLANPRRVVRALERVSVMGDAPPPRPIGYPAPVLWLGLSVDPATHRRRIAARARGQFESGLLDEVAGLRGRYPTTLPAFSAIGYREALAVIEEAMTPEEAVTATATRTWAYARRQRTWFRSESDVIWLPESESERTQVALDHVARLLGMRTSILAPRQRDRRSSPWSRSRSSSPEAEGSSSGGASS